LTKIVNQNMLQL